METKVEALEGNQKKFTITIDAADVDARIKKQYKDFANKYNFPGFRKGKAPRPVIDNVLGKEAVRATVTDDVVNTCFPLALDELDLIPVGKAEFEESEDMVEQGKPFTFAVTIEVRPEIELTSYDPVTVKLPSTEATEDEIDEQITQLLDYYYSFEDADDDTALGEHDFVEIALDVKDADGNDVEALTSETRVYELGSNFLPKAFDEALVGMKKGDKKTFEVNMAEPCVLSSAMENPGMTTMTVEVLQVKIKKVPELSDEWVKETFEMDGGIPELRDRAAQGIQEQKAQVFPRMRENEILFKLQQRVTDEVPESLVSEERQNLLQTFFQQLQQSGMTFDQYLASMGLTTEVFAEDLKRQAIDSVKRDLALEAWARHAGIEITPAEISTEFVLSGADDPSAMEEEWRNTGRLAGLRAGLKRQRALDAILEKLSVISLEPGEKTESAIAAEAARAEAAARVEEEAKAAEAAAEAEVEEAAEVPAEIAEEAEAGALSSDDLNKMKVAELRDYATEKGIAVTASMKKAELVDAILAAE